MSVADILPYFSNWQIPRQALIIEEHCNCTLHITPQHNTRPSFQRPTQLRPNWLVASAHTMAASQVHSAAAERFALTRSSRDCPLYAVWTCFKTILLFSITCTAVLYVRQCATSGLPHKSRHIFRALKMNLDRGHARLCCCDFIFYAQRHMKRTINRPRARSSYIDSNIRQLVAFWEGGVGRGSDFCPLIIK